MNNEFVFGNITFKEKDILTITQGENKGQWK